MKNIFLFLINITVITAQTQFPQRQIDSMIASKISDSDPGIMVGIVKDGSIIYEKYQGLANLEHQVKVSSKTRSNIASTAKQFTALMILELAQDGRLQLEDDIRKYLPNLYPNVKDDIKIRHLINHTSGIRDYVELMSLQGDVWWKRVGLDNGDVMDLLEEQEDLGFKPGSGYSYSNSGYVILAKLIETVTDQKFTDYSDTFFRKLGMNDTSFIKRYMGVIPNKAAPYSDWGYGELFHSISVTKTAGEGFLYTTLKDQLVFEQTVQNAKRDNNQLLLSSQLPIPNSEIKSYGFGLKLDDRLGRNAVHHDGVTDAYNAQALRFPDENLAIFIMSNNGNIRSDNLADDIAMQLLPKQEFKVTYDPILLEVENSIERFNSEGSYYSASGYLTRIQEEDNKLYFLQGKYLKLGLTQEQNNTYYFDQDQTQKIRFYKEKMMLFYPSGKSFTYQKTNAVTASPEDLEALTGSYDNPELDISFDLILNQNKELSFSFSNEDRDEEVSVFNRDDLLAGDNYILKVIRDKFNRVVELKLSYDRAKNMSFRKRTNLQFQPKIQTDFGSIQVSTIKSNDGTSSDILLTANHPNGNEIFFKRLGGSSYDKASSILATDDGYLIIGSTSSFGNGNYDMYVIKTDKDGKQQWQNTYGDFYNEYGFSGELTDSGYLLKGSKQNCDNNTDINRKCNSNVWFVEIDKNGNELSSSLLEKISKT